MGFCDDVYMRRRNLMSDHKRKLNSDVEHDDRTEAERSGTPILTGHTFTRDNITMGGPEIVINEEDDEFLDDINRVNRQKKKGQEPYPKNDFKQ